MGKLRSNRVKRTPQTGITSDRYQFLGLEQAEPNLGDALVGPSSVGANPIKAGTVYNIAAIGQYPGERYWVNPAVGIGTSLGVISVYANNLLPSNAFQRIHGLNFVGTGVTLETPPLELVGGSGIGIATIRFTVTDVLNRGAVGQVLYNTSSGSAYGAEGLYYVAGNVGIGSTIPQQKLDVSGNAIFSGIVTAAEFRGFIDGSNINNVGSAITATNVVGGIASVTSLRVSGISTLGIISATNAFLTGIITATRFVGAIDGPVLSNAATATTAFNVSGGIATVSQLYVSGISTFNGRISAGGTTGVLGQYLAPTGVGVTWATFPQLRTNFSSVASIGQTSITTPYNVGFLDVFVNGVRLPDSEYIAVDGNIININSPFFGGEVVDIFSYNVISQGIGNTFIQWSPSTSGTSIYNLSNVGIGTTNPTSKLQVSGTVLADGFISAGNTTPIQINLIGNQLTFTAVGIGSTTLTLI